MHGKFVDIGCERKRERNINGSTQILRQWEIFEFEGAFKSCFLSSPWIKESFKIICV